jgi:hypothetical protein
MAEKEKPDPKKPMITPPPPKTDEAKQEAAKAFNERDPVLASGLVPQSRPGHDPALPAHPPQPDRPERHESEVEERAHGGRPLAGEPLPVPTPGSSVSGQAAPVPGIDPLMNPAITQPPPRVEDPRNPAPINKPGEDPRLPQGGGDPKEPVQRTGNYGQPLDPQPQSQNAATGRPKEERE